MSAVSDSRKVVKEISDGGRIDVDFDLEDLEIEAVTAHACGALGCTTEEMLVQLRLQEFGKRVLCPLHAARLIRRERGVGR